MKKNIMLTLWILALVPYCIGLVLGNHNWVALALLMTQWSWVLKD